MEAVEEGADVGRGDFGQRGIAAQEGFEAAEGDVVITMDADLQNPPEEIPRIIEVMEREGVVGPPDGAKPREVLVRGYDEN